ncbi:MAG: type IV toxin-antitoxin system AbiEi family antitoxin [Micrococcales bacterium]|nr:type IV toxin-antitoxin system AbiEi family antitoxin [Micrococcales bacterium]
MESVVRVRRLPVQVAQAPMRTVRPVMLRDVYANPEKELVRLRANGLVVRIAHGTYVAKPDTVAPDEAWKPLFEEAAMAYATAAYGDRVPVLVGLGAARHWHAIPRAVGVTVVAVPEQHRPVTLDTGGKVVFTVRRTGTIDAMPVQVSLGTMLVARIEQTLVDLVLRPRLGDMPHEAETAAKALVDRADHLRLERVLTTLPAAAAARMRDWLVKTGEE